MRRRKCTVDGEGLPELGRDDVAETVTVDWVVCASIGTPNTTLEQNVQCTIGATNELVDMQRASNSNAVAYHSLEILLLHETLNSLRTGQGLGFCLRSVDAITSNPLSPMLLSTS